MLRKISTSVTFGTILAKSYQVNIVIRTFNFANLSCVIEYDTETLTLYDGTVSGTGVHLLLAHVLFHNQIEFILCVKRNTLPDTDRRIV